jgi:murein DD-endopeptidase MepM/ murein hydrolase activator NlpD
MPRSDFSLIIVPDSTGKVIERRVARWKLVSGLSFGALFILLSLFFTIGYFKANIDNQRLASLQEENKFLEQKIAKLNESVESIKGQMADIAQTDENIRLVFDLPTIDPAIREVGVGGPEYGVMKFNSPPANQLSLVEQDIDKILRQINLENASFDDVYDKIQRKKQVLDHTPTIKPCEGFITSGVGMRKDPFTGMIVMHNGLDIASSKGTPVYAPASGTVIQCGWDSGLGNLVVIDHGNDLKTYYGHLSLIKVTKGQEIKRMDVIGLVGSTGRSTGPHLHYEVQKYNRAVDPKDFFLKSIIYST